MHTEIPKDCECDQSLLFITAADAHFDAAPFPKSREKESDFPIAPDFFRVNSVSGDEMQSRAHPVFVPIVKFLLTVWDPVAISATESLFPQRELQIKKKKNPQALDLALLTHAFWLKAWNPNAEYFTYNKKLIFLQSSCVSEILQIYSR